MLFSTTACISKEYLKFIHRNPVSAISPQSAIIYKWYTEAMHDIEENNRRLLWPSFNPRIKCHWGLGHCSGGLIGARTGLVPSEHAHVFVMAPDSTWLSIFNSILFTQLRPLGADCADEAPWGEAGENRWLWIDFR
jgi:hypothetical protein